MENWKMRAFMNLKEKKVLNIDDDQITNLIVVGDSNYEMEAGEELCK